MKIQNFKRGFVASVLTGAWMLLSSTLCATPSIVADGFDTPVKLSLLKNGDVLVTESGPAVNEGRLPV